MHREPMIHRPGLVHTAVTRRWHVELLPRSGYEASYVAASPVIGFAFEAQTGMHAFAGDRRSAFRARPNHLSFLPGGCDVYSQSRQGGEYLKITLLDEICGLARAQRRFSDVIAPEAVAAAQALRCRLLAGRGQDPLEGEHLVHALVGSVTRVLEGNHRADRAATWMTSRRQALVLELIEERLGERLTVSDLADSLGLSAAFLSRAFKGALGKPPHDYIIDRRLARARLLLSAGKADLSAIAQLCGFSSHAHMSTVFRARLGVTPSHFQNR